MIIAMAMASILCILTGSYPKILYDILPYPVHYHPYTAHHVISMIQLLLLTAAAFWLYIDKLVGEPTISIDTDWFYRKPGIFILWLCSHPLQDIRLGLQRAFTRSVTKIADLSKNPVLIPEMIMRYIQLKIFTVIYHCLSLRPHLLAPSSARVPRTGEGDSFI